MSDAEAYAERLVFIKSPVIMEFPGLPDDPHLHETELESAILANLQSFLLELGKGYAFVARYSILHDSDQLFAAKYRLYLPIEEQLRAEIEEQKHVFQTQREEHAALKGAVLCSTYLAYRKT